MIYSDRKAVWDRRTTPAERYGEPCLNCNYDYGRHYGWRCPGRPSSAADFNLIDPVNRYLTLSMMTSASSGAAVTIPPLPPPREWRDVPPPANEPAAEPWREWRDVHRSSDQCACGMSRALCEYHR